MPQLDPSSFGSQLFWLALSFVTLYLIMSFLVVPRIGGTLSARQKKIDDCLSQAEALRMRAEEAKAEYEAALADSRSRALVMMQEMRAEMQAEADRQKAELDEKLAAQNAEFEQRLAKARDEALAGLNEAAVGVVSDVMTAIQLDVADEATIRASIEKALAN